LFEILTKNTQFIALHEAVKQQQLGEVELLLAAGADVNETDTLGRTPLYVAASAGALDASQTLLAEIVQALLAAGANADAATA
jgi:ankyrin repeat protein